MSSSSLLVVVGASLSENESMLQFFVMWPWQKCSIDCIADRREIQREYLFSDFGEVDDPGKPHQRD